MELERFNKENRMTYKDANPTINFSKNGLISLNQPAVDALGYKAGDFVEMLFDEKENQWYIAKSNELLGIELRMIKPKSYGFNHRLCAQTVLNNFEKTGKSSLRAMVSGTRVTHEGFEMAPLLMKRKPGINKA